LNIIQGKIHAFGVVLVDLNHDPVKPGLLVGSAGVLREHDRGRHPDEQ
jgi:hypothetical protein